MNKWTPEIKMAFVRLKAEGVRQTDIAKQLGLSVGSVSSLAFFIRKGNWREAKKAAIRSRIKRLAPVKPEEPKTKSCSYEFSRKLGIVVQADRYNGISVSGGIPLDFVRRLSSL